MAHKFLDGGNNVSRDANIVLKCGIKTFRTFDNALEVKNELNNNGHFAVVNLDLGRWTVRI